MGFAECCPVVNTSGYYVDRMPVKCVEDNTKNIGKGERKANRANRWSGPQGVKRKQK